MKKVQRYSCGNGEGMFDSKKGYWVTHEDYKNLLDKYNELKQVKNNGVLDDVINLFPSYDEALEEAQKTYLSKHVSEGVELYEEKAFMKGCNFIAQKVIGNNL